MELKIVSGPSKFDLQNALFNRRPGFAQPVEFRTECGRAFKMFVGRVEVLNNNGDTWRIWGAVTQLNGSPVRLESPTKIALYKTDTRQGELQIAGE